MKKKIALLLACVMAFGIAVGGTLAWLTAESGSVVNTFTPSNISITLDETKPVDKTAKMVPGFTIEKDPKVTVTSTSEPCWLFVKVTESANFDAFMNCGVVAAWTAGTKTADNNGNGVPVGVYFREVAAPDGTSYDVIFNDKNGDGIQGTGEETNVVSVKDTVTKKMMTEDFTQPTLTFKAAAIQLYSTNGTKFDVSVAYNNLPDEFKA